MKSRRSPGEVLVILFLLTIMVVMVVSPALSSGCDAAENCFNGVVENQGGFQPLGNLLVSTSDCPTSFEQMVILLINSERANAGLAPLALDIRLQAAARWFSTDLAINGIMFPSDPHKDSNGNSTEQRFTLQGYPYLEVGETIALGFGGPNATPEEVVQGWMGSPIHHDILLGDTYVHIGVGYTHYSGGIWDDVTVADFGSSSDGRQPPLSTCDPGFHRMFFPSIYK